MKNRYNEGLGVYGAAGACHLHVAWCRHDYWTCCQVRSPSHARCGSACVRLLMVCLRAIRLQREKHRACSAVLCPHGLACPVAWQRQACAAGDPCGGDGPVHPTADGRHHLACCQERNHMVDANRASASRQGRRADLGRPGELLFKAGIRRTVAHTRSASCFLGSHSCHATEATQLAQINTSRVQRTFLAGTAVGFWRNSFVITRRCLGTQMDVSPWLESAVWLGVDESLLTGDHVAHPRVYKSHLPFGVRTTVGVQ